MEWERLCSFLRSMDSEANTLAVVAFSGGVDSSLVALACNEVFGDRALAITIQSEFVFAHEVLRAARLARQHGLVHTLLPLRMLENPSVTANDQNRCYWCKSSIFKAIRALHGRDALILDGSNADDDPARPGLRAVREHGVISPLKACGIIKSRVRSMALERGLENHALPSNSCKATRIVRGQPIREELLDAVEKVEDYLIKKGVADMRARVDDLVMTLHYPSTDGPLVMRESKNVQHMIEESVLKDVVFKEWQT